MEDRLTELVYQSSAVGTYVKKYTTFIVRRKRWRDSKERVDEA